MKMLWNNFKVAFAMFSKIPMPEADWSRENMKYMLCFFPFIGVVIGGCSFLASRLGVYFDFTAVWIAVLLTLIPVWITGGIHVDGLLDTSDALSSWQERERRLEILKDSHAGAFAVITACVYFLLWFGACSQIWTDVSCMKLHALSFFLSRCLSGIGVVTIPKARADGTVAEFSRSAQEIRVRNILIVYLIFIGGIMLLVHPVLGAAALIGAIGIFVYYRWMAVKNFGGTTGDLSGWFLCVCEVGVLVILAVVSKLIIKM